MLCQVTSNAYADPHAVGIAPADYAQGSLNQTSYARPGKLFTASDALIVRQVASLNAAGLGRILDAVIRILRPSPA